MDHRTAEVKALVALALGLLLAFPASAAADPQSVDTVRKWLDDVNSERYEKLRETERYQFEVMNKIYARGDWKVAMNECDKYLRLYETSELAPLVLLRWSHCLAEQKQLNTAVREGYQSVIDYFPESAEAISAQYYIARAYYDLGETKKAKKAYAKLIADHPEQLVGALAREDLIAIAGQEMDADRAEALLTELAYDVEPVGPAHNLCRDAAARLARGAFAAHELAAGTKATERWVEIEKVPEQLPYRLYQFSADGISQLCSKEETRGEGLKLADEIIARLDKARPIEPEKAEQARELLTWIAAIHSRAGRRDQQGKVYEQIIKEYGATDGNLALLAGWFEGGKQYDQARGVYAKYENEVAGQENIARLWTTEGQHQKALQVYQNLCQLNPDKLVSYQYAIGDCHEAMQDWSAAIKQYQAIDDFPNNLWPLASCLRQLDQFSEARGYYQQIRTNSDDGGASRALYEIAMCYESEKNQQAAIKTLQEVCKLYPKQGSARNAHSRLQDKYDITITLGGVVEKD